MKKLTKKNLVNGALVLATVGVLGFTGANTFMAYLTDNEATSNTFTIGKIQIDLEEENYPGNNDAGVTHIVPNQVIPKDPKVENTGANDAICFITVTVPTKNIITAADDGTRNESAMTELFKTQSGDGEFGYGTSNSNWVLLSTEYDDGTSTMSNTMTDDTKMVVRTYGYIHKLAPNSSTSTVFDNVKFANIIEEQLELNDSQNINVKASAIQATDIADIATNADTLSAETLKKVYDVYLKQQSVNTQDKNANTSNAKDLKGNNI